MIDDGRLLAFLSLLGLAGAAAVRGSRGIVRRGRGKPEPELHPPSQCRWCRLRIVDGRLDSGAVEADWMTTAGDFGCSGGPGGAHQPALRRGSPGVVRAGRKNELEAELYCRPNDGLNSRTLYVVRVGPNTSSSSEEGWVHALAALLLDMPEAPSGEEVTRAVLKEVDRVPFAIEEQGSFSDACAAISDAMLSLDSEEADKFTDWYIETFGHQFGEQVP